MTGLARDDLKLSQDSDKIFNHKTHERPDDFRISFFASFVFFVVNS